MNLGYKIHRIEPPTESLSSWQKRPPWDDPQGWKPAKEPLRHVPDEPKDRLWPWFWIPVATVLLLRALAFAEGPTGGSGGGSVALVQGDGGMLVSEEFEEGITLENTKRAMEKMSEIWKEDEICPDVLHPVFFCLRPSQVESLYAIVGGNTPHHSPRIKAELRSWADAGDLNAQRQLQWFNIYGAKFEDAWAHWLDIVEHVYPENEEPSCTPHAPFRHP